MSWRNLEHRESLKDLTTKLLADERTLWSISSESDTRFRLEWKTYEADKEVFLKVASLLWDTRKSTDKDFKQTIHPQVLSLLAQSEIFKRLSDTHIQVTRAHTGVVPFQHIKNVAEAAAAEQAGLNDYQVFIIRLAAYVHDLGKAISSGIPTTEIREMMTATAHPGNSYPNHDQISFLVLERFSDDEDVAEFITQIGQSVWRLLLLVIRNHHFLDFKKIDQVDEYEQWKNEIPSITKDVETLEAFLLTFAFSYADICSNENYKPIWPDKVRNLEHLFTEVIESVNQNLTQLRIVLAERLK